MSQQLCFTLKRKTNSDITIDIGCFYTTLARMFASETNLKYTEKEIVIEEDALQRAIGYLAEKRDCYIEKRISISNEIHDLEELLCKCASAEVVKGILEHIREVKIDLDKLKDEAEDYEYYINKIKLILEIYSDNKEDWSLYYYNC